MRFKPEVRFARSWSRVRETRPWPCVRRAKPRALILDESGQGARPMRHPCRMAGGKRPVSRPSDESGLKPSLATTTAKASERVIAGPRSASARANRTSLLRS